MPANSKLMPAFLAYEALSDRESDLTDALRGQLEEVLAKGIVLTPADLFAKARYLQHTARIDPGLISMEAVDTLVVGIALLCGDALSQPAAMSAAA